MGNLRLVCVWINSNKSPAWGAEGGGCSGCIAMVTCSYWCFSPPLWCPPVFRLSFSDSTPWRRCSPNGACSKYWHLRPSPRPRQRQGRGQRQPPGSRRLPPLRETHFSYSFRWHAKMLSSCCWSAGAHSSHWSSLHKDNTDAESVKLQFAEPQLLCTYMLKSHLIVKHILKQPMLTKVPCDRKYMNINAMEHVKIKVIGRNNI